MTGLTTFDTVIHPPNESSSLTADHLSLTRRKCLMCRMHNRNNSRHMATLSTSRHIMMFGNETENCATTAGPRNRRAPMGMRTRVMDLNAHCPSNAPRKHEGRTKNGEDNPSKDR